MDSYFGGENHPIKTNSSKQNVLEIVNKKSTSEFEKWALEILKLKETSRSLDSNAEVSEIEALAFLVLDRLLKYHKQVKGREVEFEGYIRTGVVLERDKIFYEPKAKIEFTKYIDMIKESENMHNHQILPEIGRKSEIKVNSKLDESIFI